VISDQGGTSEISTIMESYTEKLADIDILVRLMTADIATNGLFTPSGKVRDVYDKLILGLAAFDRYAQRIGLDRRPKQLNPLDAIQQAVDEANR